MAPVFRSKFSAIHREYTAQPSNRTFYVHLTTVTDPKATRVLLVTGPLAVSFTRSKLTDGLHSVRCHLPRQPQKLSHLLIEMWAGVILTHGAHVCSNYTRSLKTARPPRSICYPNTSQSSIPPHIKNIPPHSILLCPLSCFVFTSSDGHGWTIS